MKTVPMLRRCGVSVLALTCISAIGAQAALLASDNASDPAYSSGLATGTNGGTGFGAWTIAATSGGAFINGTSNDQTNLPAPVFNIWNDAGDAGVLDTDVTTANRPFTGALSPGQSFSFSDVLHWGRSVTGGIASLLGWSLLDSSGQPVLDFHSGGGFDGYYLTDKNNSLLQDTNVQYNYDSADQFKFTLNDASGDYTLTTTGASVSGGSETITGQIDMSTGGPAEFLIYNNNGGTNSDLQFNNLAITVPEPAGLALAAVGFGAMLRRRRNP